MAGLFPDEWFAPIVGLTILFVLIMKYAPHLLSKVFARGETKYMKPTRAMTFNGRPVTHRSSSGAVLALNGDLGVKEIDRGKFIDARDGSMIDYRADELFVPVEALDMHSDTPIEVSLRKDMLSYQTDRLAEQEKTISSLRHDLAVTQQSLYDVTGQLTQALGSMQKQIGSQIVVSGKGLPEKAAIQTGQGVE